MTLPQAVRVRCVSIASDPQALAVEISALGGALLAALTLRLAHAWLTDRGYRWVIGSNGVWTR